MTWFVIGFVLGLAGGVLVTLNNTKRVRQEIEELRAGFNELRVLLKIK